MTEARKQAIRSWWALRENDLRTKEEIYRFYNGYMWIGLGIFMFMLFAPVVVAGLYWFEVI